MLTAPRLEQQISSLLLNELRERFPGVRLGVMPEPAATPGFSDQCADAIVRLGSADGRSDITVAIVARRQVEPRDVPRLVEQADRCTTDVVMIGAPFLSTPTRRLLSARGLSYIDLTGNFLLSLKEPFIYIERQGADKSPWPDTRPLQSLKGPAAGRVVRALCDFTPPYGVDELARRSETSNGTVSRVVNLLDREAFLERTRRGSIVTVRWVEILRRWVQDYSFQTSNTVIPCIAPRGLERMQERLKSAPVAYAITGSLAANAYTPTLPTRLGAIYVDQVEELEEYLQLRRVETGTNVFLVQPFDSVVFDRSRTQDDLIYVAASQAAADLLTGPGRSPAEAEILIEWMKDHPDVWQS